MSAVANGDLLTWMEIRKIQPVFQPVIDRRIVRWYVCARERYFLQATE